MAVQVKTRIKNRWDSAQAWRQANPILLQGEIAVETENGRIRFKAGDGQTKYVDLPYAGGSQVSVDGVVSDFGVLHISQEEYARRLADGSLLSNELYIVSSDYIDAYGQQLKNLSAPTEISDAATKGYVDDAVRGVRIPTDLSAFTNSPGYLVSDDVSCFCQKSEVSAALSAKADISSLDFSKVILSANSISSKIDDLVINSVTKAEYDAMLLAGTLCSDQLYSIDSLQLDARGDWVVNVKTPDLSSDAANKAYVDSQLSNAGGGYAFDMYNPPFDSINNMYVLKPGKFNILSSAVTDGCVLVLEDYDEDKIYKVKLSCDPANAAHISLLADDNSATESPGAYSVSKLNGKVDWLSPSQVYRFEVSYGNVTVNDDYNGDSLVTLKPFETQTEPIDQYDPGETLYHLLPVDNAVNYLSALTGNRTYNLHMPPVQSVNGVRRMRQFKLVPSSAGFGEVGAQLSILNRDIENKLVSFRYKTDKAHASAPLSGEALVFMENKRDTFDVFFENELELDSAKIAAIDSIISERATTIQFLDGEVSSFNWSGWVSQNTLIKAGLIQTEDEGEEYWVHNPVGIKFGTGVTRIRGNAFQYSGLSSVVFPGSVVQLDENSFYGCNGLSVVEFSDGLRKIGWGAFDGCVLADVVIPESVTRIDGRAFDCQTLSSITVIGKTQEQAEALLSDAALPAGCTITTWNAASLEQLSGLEQLSSKQDKLADAQLSDIDYIPYLKPENTVVVFTDGTVSSFNVNYINSSIVQSWGKEPKSIKIGTNCTNIAGGFKDKTSLTSITFAEERTTELTVQYQAFQNTGITSIVIPEFVKFKDYGNLHHQFSYCQNLKEVIYKCSSINNTFAYSPNLTSIAFTDNLKYIGSTVFYENQNLKYISIPNSVTAIEKSAFHFNTGLTSIVLPEKIHDIKDSIFFRCSSLANIAIPSEVSSIYAQAFWGCSSLTSIDIPDSVKRIGIDTVMPTNHGQPFGNCVNLSNVTVGTGVTDIISNAFDNCTNLTSIVFRNRLSSEIPSGAPWGATNAIVSTWNDASQEWVNERIPYKLNNVSASSYELKNHTVNYYEFANDVSSVTFSMPTATSSYVADFLLDVKNSNASDSTIEFDGLDTSFKLVVKENDDLVGMTTIAPNEMARFYITQTGFQLSGLPTFEISKKVVVEATA